MATFKIRRYKPSDHRQVCETFKNGVLQQNQIAITRVLTGETWKSQLIMGLLVFYFSSTYIQALTIILLLELACFASIFSWYYGYQRVHMATDMADPDLKHWTQNGHAFFVACDVQNPERILGIASTQQYQMDGQEVAEFCRFFVNSDAQGRGIGSALMKTVLDYIKDNLHVSKIVLDTSTPRAMRIYEKFGFFHEKNILLWEFASIFLFIMRPLHGIEHRLYSLYLKKSELFSVLSMAAVKIRQYQSSDHDQVRKLFSDGMVEHFEIFLRRFFRGDIPRQTYFNQIIFLSTIFLLSAKLVTFTVISLLTESIILFNIFWFYYGYQRKQLQTDMADPELRLFTENGHKIFLAVHEQNPHFILGMAGARLVLEDGKEVGEFCRFFVKSQAQGHGIGTELIKHSLQYMTNFKVNKIILDTSTPGAIRIYEKLGFFHEKNLQLAEFCSIFLNFTKPLHGIEYRQYCHYIENY